MLVMATLIAGAIHAVTTGTSFAMYVALSGLLIVEAGRSLETNFFQAARRQKPMTLISVGEMILRPTMVAALVLLTGPTPQAVLLGYAIGSGTIYLTALALLRREGMSTGPAEERTHSIQHDPIVRDIWRYALPLIPLAGVGWITGVSDRYILGLLRGTTQVGIYTTTYGLMSQPFLIVMAIISRTMSPIYNKAISDGNEELAGRSFRAWIWGTVAVCGAGFVAVIFLRHWIARFLLAAEFRSGAALMPWIAAGYALYAVGCVFEARLYARKLTGRILFGQTVVAATSIVVPVAFLYKWGVTGVAAACPVYFAVLVVVMWRLSRVQPDRYGQQ